MVNLTPESPMPWGKYKGTPLGEVPAPYWRYLWNDGVRTEDNPLGRYLRKHAAEIREQDIDGRDKWKQKV